MVRQFEYLKRMFLSPVVLISVSSCLRTEEDVDHFMDKGYIVIHDAFTKEKAAEWTESVWVRLGFDPNDKKTWTTERTHMPCHRKEPVATFAPKASLLANSPLDVYSKDVQ